MSKFRLKEGDARELEYELEELLKAHEFTQKIVERLTLSRGFRTTQYTMATTCLKEMRVILDTIDVDIDLGAGIIFEDDFESSTTDQWSGTEP